MDDLMDIRKVKIKMIETPPTMLLKLLLLVLLLVIAHNKIMVRGLR